MFLVKDRIRIYLKKEHGLKFSDNAVEPLNLLIKQALNMAAGKCKNSDKNKILKSEDIRGLEVFYVFRKDFGELKTE